MVNQTHAAVWEMIEAGGRTVQYFGLNRLLGQIYVLLYLSHESLSLDAISTELGVSKASASIACRQLEAWGAVRCMWKRGDRRDYYEAESDMGVILKSGLMGSILKKLDSAHVQIERSLRLLDEGGLDDKRVAFLRKKLKDAESRRGRLATLLKNPLIRKML